MPWHLEQVFGSVGCYSAILLSIDEVEPLSGSERPQATYFSERYVPFPLPEIGVCAWTGRCLANSVQWLFSVCAK